MSKRKAKPRTWDVIGVFDPALDQVWSICDHPSDLPDRWQMNRSDVHVRIHMTEILPPRRAGQRARRKS